MIHEFTLVLDREPTDAELEAPAATGLDPIGTEGPHPALAHLSVGAATLPAGFVNLMWFWPTFRALERFMGSGYVW